MSGFTLDKLAGIRGDLVRSDNNWKNWEFPELIEALRKWTERNPTDVDQRRELPKKDRLLQARQGQQTKRECIYCGSKSHRVFEYNKVKGISGRRQIVATKKLGGRTPYFSLRKEKWKLTTNVDNSRQTSNTSYGDCKS